MELRFKGEVTVKSLKEILEMYDDDCLVLVDGYEGGVMSLFEKNITEDVVDYQYLTDAGVTAEYEGDHGLIDIYSKEPIETQISKFKNPVKAITLGRHA